MKTHSENRVLYVMIVLFALLVSAASRALAEEPQELTLQSLFEARGYNGSFHDVRGAAADDRHGWVGVLEGGPLRIDWFKPDSGFEVRQDQLPDPAKCAKDDTACLDTSPATDSASLAVCRNNLIVASGLNLYLLTPEGEKAERRTAPLETTEKNVWVKKILCDSKNRLWVLFGNPNRLVQLDGDKITADIARPEKPKLRTSEVNSLDDVTFDRDGSLLLADATAGNVKRFSPDGKSMGIALQSDRMNPRGLSKPSLLAVDPHNDLWVYDADDHMLKVYDSVGFYKYWVSETTHEGFIFMQPVWMAVDRSGHLLIIDRASRTLRGFDASNVY